MRRNVRAVFVDEKQRPARRKPTPMRRREVMQRDDERDENRDREEPARFAFHFSYVIPSVAEG
jgi:hypothetical protein